MPERIAIAGAGVAGSYLHRLLRRRGIDADLFDISPSTRCGLNPCAWGTARQFLELVSEAGLEPDDYVLRRLPYLVVDDTRVKADLLTCDKPRLLRDLRGDATVRKGSPDLAAYDRVVDATGVARAFLPPVHGDITFDCAQFRVRGAPDLENRVRLGEIGYAWCLPLEQGGFHLGCGSLTRDPRTRMAKLGWIQAALSEGAGEIVCGCQSRIRLTGPAGCLPFVSRANGAQIWGAGESIGCVAPLAGDGIVPGMRSAQILLAHWEDPEGYRREILREFEWMEAERGVLDKLIRGRRLWPRDALVLRENSRRMGMDIDLPDALRLVRHLR